jgi:hypothetical protein
MVLTFDRVTRCLMFFKWKIAQQFPNTYRRKCCQTQHWIQVFLPQSRPNGEISANLVTLTLSNRQNENSKLIAAHPNSLDWKTIFLCNDPKDDCICLLAIVVYGSKWFDPLKVLAKEWILSKVFKILWKLFTLHFVRLLSMWNICVSRYKWSYIWEMHTFIHTYRSV